MKQNHGFSLVELAISVMIIGLLVAAISKGQQILLSSRITATVAQVDNYRKALASFEDMYFALPGDFDAATSELPGCLGNTTCANGDGNGVITEDGGDGSDWTAWNARNIASTSQESVQFWKHLAAADLIGGVDVLRDPTGNNFAWKETHPASPFGGGFEFFHDTSNTMGHSSHFLRLSRDAIHSGGELDILSPHDVQIMDLKADDGQAFSGDIVVDYGAGSNDCHNDDQYLATVTNKTCTVFFVFRD